jgi:hypothetical protein
MLLLALVFLGKNFFEPICLFFRGPFISDWGLLKDGEHLTAVIASKASHFLEGGCFLVTVTLFNGDCVHDLLNCESPVVGSYGASIVSKAMMPLARMPHDRNKDKDEKIAKPWDIGHHQIALH